MAHPVISAARNLIRLLLRLGEYVGWVILLFWVALLTIGSFARYLLSAPLIFQADLTSALLLVFCALNFGPILVRHAHVRVDTIIRWFPARYRTLLDTMNDVVTIAFCAIMILLSQGLLRMTAALGSKFEVSGIPMLPFQIIMIAGFVLMALASVLALIDRYFFSEASSQSASSQF